MRRRPPQVCNHLERLSVDLEAAAHPALDALTRKVPRIDPPSIRRHVLRKGTDGRWLDPAVWDAIMLLPNP